MTQHQSPPNHSLQGRAQYLARCLHAPSDTPLTSRSRNRREGGTEKPSRFSSWLPAGPQYRKRVYWVTANNYLCGSSSKSWPGQGELTTRQEVGQGHTHNNTSLSSSHTICFTLQQSQQLLCSYFKRVDEICFPAGSQYPLYHVQFPALPAHGTSSAGFKTASLPPPLAFPFHSSLCPALHFQALFTEATRSTDHILYLDIRWVRNT